MIAIPNTFGIKAHASRMIEYGSPDELRKAIPTLAGQPFMHIGRGSNLLFTKDYEGTVLHSAICSIDVIDEDADVVTVRVGSGMVWDDFVAYSIRQGWSGAENLSLIPGEVGASAVQNIGAYGVEAQDLIQQVECIDLQTGSSRTFSNQECQYAYRSSIFKTAMRGHYAVVYVTYRLSKHFTPRLEYGNIAAVLNNEGDVTPQAVRQAIIDIRRSKLPNPEVTGNAGSFFMNPIVSRSKYDELIAQYHLMPHYDVADGVKIPAGWLIEQCGWKGRSLGAAAVHDRQALVLVNLGGATGEDILRLCRRIQDDVRRKFDIELKPEVNII